MNITSSIFLFMFFPIAIAIYYVIPAKKTLLWRNIYLLIISLMFYAYGEPIRILLIVAMTLATWALGFMAHGNRNTKKGKWAVALAVIMNVGALFVYKYLESLLAGFGYIFKYELPSLNLALPLGLSFFCFSSISYVVDVYRGKIKSHKNLLNTSLYLSIFFKITQGPTCQFNQFEKFLYERKTTSDQFVDGMWRFIFGLGKKVLLAGGLSYVVSYSFNSNYADLPVTTAWLGSFAYMLQLYFDFSGYSDMAIGMAKMLGFEMPENFNYPYAATSVTDYWNRWHITLGDWFRDYIYYPVTLGPAIKIRKKMATKKYSKAAGKFVVNLFTLSIIWFCSSVWHGKSVNYLIWGLINGGVSLLELYKKPMKNKKLDRALGWLYTFFIALMVKTLTYVDTLGEAVNYYGAMFGAHGNPFSDTYFVFLLKEYAVYLIVGTIAAFPLFKWINQKIQNSNKQYLKVGARVVSAVFAVAILVLSISFMQRSGVTSFMYQQF